MKVLSIHLFLCLAISTLFAACSGSSGESDANHSEPEVTVPENPLDVSPLLIGESVPDISLPNHQGEMRVLIADTTSLTLLIFYRGGWCPYCSAELAEIAAIEQQITDMGVNIVGISPDRPEYLQSTMDENQSIGYTLLSDSQMEASNAFGIAFRVDDDTFQRYKSNGLDLEERSGETHRQLPVPAVFLAGGNGVIQFQYVDPDYTQRINKEMLLAAIEAVNENSQTSQ